MERFFSKFSGQQLAYQVTKYISRKVGKEDWSVRDIIILSHLKASKMPLDSQIVLSYVMKGINGAKQKYEESEKTEDATKVLNYLKAVEATKSENCDKDTAIQFIREYHLPREVLNTKLLTEIDVWKALLYTSYVSNEENKIIKKITMPMTALIRNLGVMSQRGLFEDKDIVDSLCKHLKNIDVLRKARIHPIALLVAKTTYDNGKGHKGNLKWTVNKQISQALEDAFYIAFDTIKGTGKRVLHAVDCSGSMESPMACMPGMTSTMAVSTLVMEAVKREYAFWQETKKTNPNAYYAQDVCLFSHQLKYIDIEPDMEFSTVRKLFQDSFGATDCALPMINALNTYKKSGGKNGLYDLFMIYTDSETWCGKIHPSEALENYRKETGIDAKMVVVATTATNNSIAFFNTQNYHSDQQQLEYNTQNYLNISGFDLNAPELIRNFANGKLGNSNNVEDEYVILEIGED